MKVEIELPDKYEIIFKYMEMYSPFDRKKYIEKIVIEEIESRNIDLHIF